MPENPAQGDPYGVAQIIWGARTERYGCSLVGGAGASLAAAALCSAANAADVLIGSGALSTAAVPWTAFMDGHPYRIRYIVPLIAVEAIGAGMAGGAAGAGARRWR